MKLRKKFGFNNVSSLLAIEPDATEDEWHNIKVGGVSPPYRTEDSTGPEGFAAYVARCEAFILGIAHLQTGHHIHAVKIKVRVSEDTTLRGTVIDARFDSNKGAVVLTVSWQQLHGSQEALKALPRLYHLPWCNFSRHPAEWKSGQTLCPEEDIYTGPLPSEMLKAAA